MAEYEIEVPDYVERYLLKSIAGSLPPEVLETLASMTPEEIAALEKLGAALDRLKAAPHTYMYSVH